MAVLLAPATSEPATSVRAFGAEAPRFRFAAFVGAVACALYVVGWFLPWVLFPAPERERIRRALEPSIEALAVREPEHAERYRVLVQQVVEEGTLSGLDLHHFARTALAMNETLVGPVAPGHERERPSVVQRGLRAARWVLLGIPALCAGLALLLLARGLRRISPLELSSLVILGVCSTNVAARWLAFAESLTSGVVSGAGMHVSLAAAVLQTLAGLFGVSSRTWWRVYVVAVVGLLGIGFGLARYVTIGAPW
jgi:hypothetical protein